jgi:FkbM family methyltransferase
MEFPQLFSIKRVSPTRNTPTHHNNNRSSSRRNSVVGIVGLILFLLSVLNSTLYQLVETTNDKQQEDEEFFPTKTTTTNDIPSRRLPYELNCSSVVMNNSSSSSTYQWVQTSTNPSFQMSVHPPSEDIYVSGSIANGAGCWECDLVRLVQDKMQKYPDAYFIDLGANIGMYALTVAAMGQAVFAFEPMRRNYEHICRSWQADQFPTKHHQQQQQLRVFSVAASNQVNKFTFETARSNIGGTRIIPLVVNHAIDMGTNQPPLVEGNDFAWAIPLDSIRDIFPKNRPVVIKMDIEGSEINAMLGAVEFLKQADIVLMVAELRKEALFKSPTVTDAIMGLLQDKDLHPMEMQGSERSLEPLGYTWREWKRFQSNDSDVFLDTMWVRSD